MIDEREQARLLRLLWAADCYTPTTGYWPILDLEGNERTVSRGQQEIHDCQARLVMVTGGVRAGKSQFLAMELLRHIFKPNGLIWLVGPDYWQARQEFDYMYGPLKALGFIEKESIPEKGARTFTTLWGCRVETKSAQDLATIASAAPHVLAGVEMGQQPHQSYEKLQERALQHRARIFMTGTLEDAQPWYADLWERWQGDNPEGGRSFSLPSWSNARWFPGGREDVAIKELEASLSPEMFLQRVAAIPYKPSGLVFKLFDRGRHVKTLDYDPALPVELAIDPAQHTYAVLAVQWRVIPGMFTTNAKGHRIPLTEVWVVDEVYEHDITAYDIIPMVQARPWFKAVRGGVIDVAGKQQHANKSQVQIWREETGLNLRSRKVFIPDSIEVVRNRLRIHPQAKQPLLYFDYRLRSDRDVQGRANGLLAEFGLYKWPDWKEGMASAARPIDANNDACKALGYWLVDKFGLALERPRHERRVAIRGYL